MENSRIGMKIGMKTTTLLILFLLALAGCSTNSERDDYMKDAAKGRPLDMPPDIVLPKSDDKYVVPDGSAETVTTYSEFARSNAAQNQACVCKDAAAAPPDKAQTKAPQPAAAVAVPPKLQDRPDGSKSILIAEPFDRCWLKVGQALDQAAIAVEDKDRSKGLFYLKDGHSRLSVQARPAEPGAAGGGAAGCEVSASNGSGAASYESKRIMDALYKNLSK